jgi:phosphoribosylamine---glycine ligase
MRVLVVGSGGREHALAWKVSQSPLASSVFCWPGNPAMGAIANRFDLPGEADFASLAAVCKLKAIDLVIVGPEGPLSMGIADHLTREGIPVFGPNAKAAKLESSKSFAKKMMVEAGIPTASFEICRQPAEANAAATRIFHRDGGVVLKASGLASGKGVFVCRTEAEIQEGFSRLFGDDMREASQEIVIEEMLYGRECSYFCFLGQGKMTRLGFAVDHKRLLVGDKGPNTGGMGCYTPVPWLPDNAGDIVEERVVKPLLGALARHGITYEGCLYVGLMWSDRGPSVVEFNVRFGDPEAQVLAFSDGRDWLKMIASQLGLVKDTVDESTLVYAPKPAIGYVLAASNYPFGEGVNQTGLIPKSLFLTEKDDAIYFLANATESKDDLKTGSGRVMLVAGRGATFASAKSKALTEIDKVKKIWPHFQWRSDIASSALKYEEATVEAARRIPIILGSSSPRRKELLGSLGVDFVVIKPETDEVPAPNESPSLYVKRNAMEKNEWLRQKLRASYPDSCLIISADTIVTIEQEILEKPLSVEHARSMLRKLSGRTHTVLTSVVISLSNLNPREDLVKQLMVATDVTLRPLSEEEIDSYVSTGEPFDKAGGYAAQGLGSFMVQGLMGSFSNVVGLPLAELSLSLSRDFGIKVFRDHG